MIVDRPRRSALFLPASNARALAKARSLRCDVVILDLEDAVAPEAKIDARAAAIAAVREGGWGGRELVVRANALDTPWGADDLAALAAAAPDAVLLPKVSTPAEVAAIEAALGDADTALWIMIETARGVLSLDALGAAGKRLAAFVLGFNDLAKELRMPPSPDRAPLLPILGQAVMAARAHGLIVLDAVCNDFQDPTRMAAECDQARAWGCDGKTLIHPAQISAANAAFAPSAEALAEADAIVTAFGLPENAGKGAIKLGGRMVELLHLDAARRLRALADRIAAMETD